MHDVSPGRAALVLTIGASVEVGVSWLTPWFDRFQAHRPDRDLRISLGDGAELIARVRDGLLDCAIASVDAPPDGLACHVLHRQTHVFVASSRLVRRRRLSRREHAAHHVLVDMSEDRPLFRNFVDALGDPAPWSFARVECFETVEAIRGRLLEGAGVAVLPLRTVEGDLRVRRLTRLMRDIALPDEVFALVWHPDHARGAELRGLAAELAHAPLR